VAVEDSIAVICQLAINFYYDEGRNDF